VNTPRDPGENGDGAFQGGPSTPDVPGHESAELVVLRRELHEAVARARDLEHELGRLRGRMLLLETTSFWRRTWRRAVRGALARATRLLQRG
jgi:hypothetical protein